MSPINDQFQVKLIGNCLNPTHVNWLNIERNWYNCLDLASESLLDFRGINVESGFFNIPKYRHGLQEGDGFSVI